MDKQKVEVDVSILAIIKIALVILGFLFLWLIKDILILFFIVLVIVAALSPVVDRWSRKMNRVAAISLIYIILVVVISAISFTVFPPLIHQIQSLSRDLPDYFGKYLPSIGFGRDLLNISQDSLATTANQLSAIGGEIFNATIGVFSGIVAAFTVIVLTFYLLLEEHGAKKFVLRYLPLENRASVTTVLQKIGYKMGAWLRGQLILGLIIGIVDGTGLGLLGVKYALTLGVWAGVTELIPYIGPIIGAIPGVIIAFAISPIIGVLALALYVVVQQFESNFLVPKIMQRAVGLSPIIIILAILIGARIDGILGIILAIPLAGTISVVVVEWPSLKKIIKK